MTPLRTNATLLFLGVSACTTGTIALTPTAAAQPTSQFDGTWNVILSCPARSGGTPGYSRRFLASVQGGMLYGQSGAINQAGFLALGGTIQPSGVALLTGYGRTGDLDHVVGRSATASLQTFHMQARFSASSGTGSRFEVRRCGAVFSKQQEAGSYLRL